MPSSAKPTVDIVCMATRRLDNPMPTNVQHLMLRLAHHHRVLYVEPPVDPVFLARHPRRRSTATPLEIPPGMNVLSPVILPWAHRFDAIAGWNRRLLASQVRKRAKALSFERPLLWLFSPRDVDMLDAIEASAVCYHITDAYKAMPSSGDAATVEAAEQRIIDAADHVFVTSAQLASDRDLTASRVHVVPNVADVDHFAAAARGETEIPEDIARIPTPIAGFFGAIDDYKVDFELLSACARGMPDVSFVLIGPAGWADDTPVPEALRLENVHFLGPRSFADLPSYLKAFTVALIPYRLNDYTRYCSPLKLYEYLAAGVGVVATDLPALREAGEHVTIAHTAETFSAGIRECINADEDARQHRIQFAAQHSWSRRMSEIETILDEYAPR